MKRPPVSFCLAVSHADVAAAKLWLRWAVFLSKQPGGDVSRRCLLVVLTKRVSNEDFADLIGIAEKQPTFFRTAFKRCPDQDERGYPGSSSHLFARSLQLFNELLPDHAMMFCEADTVPTRPTWAKELAEDYARRKAPFVGLHIPSTRDAVDTYGMVSPHLTGNAFYPPNALQLAPSILQCLSAKTENCPWGEKGWAWDLFCAHEIVPESEITDKIQQIWRSDPWTPANLHRLDSRAALFHQSKDGSLIVTLALKSYPEFLEQVPMSGHCFMLETGARSVTVAGQEIKFRPAARILGKIIAICRPATPIEDVLLLSAAGRAGLTLIPPEDFAKLSAQADRNRLD